MPAPAAFTARAIASVCARLSTVQGPAMTTVRPSPMVTGPAFTGRVFSWAEERETLRGGWAGFIARTPWRLGGGVAPAPPRMSEADEVAGAVPAGFERDDPVPEPVEGEGARGPA